MSYNLKFLDLASACTDFSKINTVTPLYSPEIKDFDFTST